jgi:uroporphyrinogen-III decarboxylase
LSFCLWLCRCSLGVALLRLRSRSLPETKILRCFARHDCVICSKSLGAKVKLHICGNSTALLPKIRDLVKPDIMDIDWMVDFEKVVKLFSGTRTAINGNMDPVSVMLRGDADTVREAVLHCIKASQSNTCIAAGCEIPVDTPEDNLLTMNRLLYI